MSLKFLSGQGIDGNVGIGTNVPVNKLEINGVTSFTGGLVAGVTDNHTAGAYLNTTNRGLSGNFSGYARNLISSIAGGIIEIGQGTSLISQIKLNAGSSGVNGSVILMTKGATRLTVSPGGNVGIGETNPQNPLHVSGSLRVGPFLTPDRDGFVFLTGGSLNTIQANNENTNFDNNQGNIHIRTFNNSSGTPVERISVLSTGKVGIGQNNPTDLFEVVTTGTASFGNKKYATYTGQDSGAGTGNGFVASLNDTQGTTLNQFHQYKFYLTTTGTGTYNSSVYIVYRNTSNNAWIARAVSLGGGSSNHPLLTISGNNAIIYDGHNATYTVLYRVETTYSGQALTSPNIFGADSMWKNSAGTLLYPDGSVGINATGTGGKLEVGGNIKVNAGNGEGLFVNSTVGTSGFVRRGGTGVSIMTNSTDRLTITNAGGATFSGTLTASGGINGLTLANGGISGSNYDISGVNQLSISDPGEGIVFNGTTQLFLDVIDDAADDKLRIRNATQLDLNSTARITNLVNPSAAQDAATKAYVDSTAAGESTWPNVGAGSRTNYTLGFTQTAAQGQYAGFYFETAAGTSNAGYFLLRGGSDNSVYKQGGITLVGDAATLTIATRTLATSNIRFMTGATSTTRLQITGTGAFALGTSSSAYGTSGQVFTSNGNATPSWTTISTGVQSVATGNTNTIGIGGTATNPTVAANTGTVNATSAKLATGAQIQTAINTALTGVLQFEGTWNASTNTPTLSSGSGTSGDYYIVSVAGNTNLDGITDWQIGDWAVFANTTWTKIDNTQVGNVTGSGSNTNLAIWNSNSNITSNNSFTTSGTRLIGSQLAVGDGTDGYFYSDTAGRTAFASGDFYIQSSVNNSYNYATNQYIGNSSGDNIFFRSNAVSGTNWNFDTSGNFTALSLTSTNGLSVGSSASIGGTITIGGNTLVSGYVRLGGKLSTQYIPSLSAAATQCRQYEIARAFMDYNDWNNTGVIKINLMEEYFDEGYGKEYAIRWGYNNTVDIDLINVYGGGNDNGFECVIGSLVQVGTSDIYYLPIIVKCRYYAVTGAEVITNRTITTNANSTAGGVIYINSSPTPVNISDFTIVDSVEFSGAADNINLGTASTKVGIGFADSNLPSRGLDVNVGARFRSYLYDVNNAAGTAGDVLTSTGSGVDWVSPGTPGSGIYLPINNPTFTGTLTGPNANFTSTVTVDNMLTITIDDISTGENRGLRLINENQTDQQWNITAGITGVENESFCIRNSTDNINALTIARNSTAVFAGTIKIGTPTNALGQLNTTGQVYIEQQGTNWNETTPGNGRGAIHFDPVGSGANNTGNAITFGASDTSGGSTGQAGIYVRSDGSYGTKMYIATTDSYATGSKSSITIDEAGDVLINRGHLTISDVPAASTSGNAFLVSNSGQVQRRTNAQVLSDIGATGNLGTVTSIATTNGISGGTITTSGTLQVDSSVIRNQGNQTLGGIKTFTSTIEGNTSGSFLLRNDGSGVTTQRGNGTVAYPFAINSTTAGLFPASDNANSIFTLNRHPGNYYSQLGFSSNGNIYYRKFANVAINTTQAWVQLAYTSQLTGGTVTSIATGNGITGGTITTSGTLQVDSTVVRTTGGQTISGNKEFAPTSTSTSYSTASIELRESNYSGSGGTPPRIGFHWGGVVASSMTIEANGTIAVRNNPGNNYEQFAASNLTLHSGNITLNGTGRIQGIDTVSATTDAANKAYVDAAVAGVPQGDITAIVAGSGMTGTSLSGPIPTLNVIGGNGITANADDIQVDATVLRTGGGQTRSDALVIKGSIQFPSSNLGQYARGSRPYAIYQESGAWTNPYPDLNIAMHTGISFGANSGYNGMRFFNDYTMATQVMSINNGSDGLGANNVFINNQLQVNGGGITLGGTGRIQGIDTVSASTDAANKAYVDSATGGAMTGFGVSNLPSGTGSTFTITNGQTVGIIGGTNIQSVVSTANETITLNYTGPTGSGSVTSIATTSPILGGTITTSGTISLLSPASGAWFRGAPRIGSDGLMEIGRYVDFHNTNAGTSDFDVRLDCYSAGNLRLTGSLNVTSDLVVNSQIGAGITPASGITIQAEGKIRSSDDNSADHFDMYCDGSNSGNSFLENTNSSIVIKSANATTVIDASGAAATLDIWNSSNGAAIRLKGSGDSYIAGGDLGIGNTAPTSGIKLDVTGNVLFKNSNGVADLYLGNYATANHFRFHTNNADTYFDMNCGNVYWRDGSSIRYRFFPSTANMTINGTLTQNSDIRIKENVVEIDDCISKVQAMRGVYYNRTDFNTEVTKVGVIAQEVEAVLPELILENEDDGLKSVAYSELTAVLINAIKEQQQIIEDLKTRVEQLEK